MSTTRDFERGREAYARREWQDAYASLSAADAVSPLAPGSSEYRNPSQLAEGDVLLVGAGNSAPRSHSS